MSKDTLIICNALKKSEHCKEVCRCGKPHHKMTERDACHLKHEWCNLGGPIQKVICVEIPDGKK